MIFCHKNEKEITLGADSAQENRGSRAKVSTRKSKKNYHQAHFFESNIEFNLSEIRIRIPGNCKYVSGKKGGTPCPRESGAGGMDYLYLSLIKAKDSSMAFKVRSRSFWVCL